MKLNFLLPIVVLLLLGGRLSAQESTSPVDFLLGMNLEYGGEELLELTFTNGETQDMNAGQGITVFAGGRLRLLDRLFADGSLGVKYVTTAAENVDIRFLRFPVEAVLRYEPGAGVFLAGGVTKHLGSNLKVSGNSNFGESKTEFDSSLGLRVEAGWKWIGLSYTNLKYSEQTSGEEFDANVVGISLRYAF